MLQRGATAWNRWRKANPEVRPNLIRAKLRGLDLRGFKLFGAKLSQAELNEAILTNVSFHSADLSGAFLSRADLAEAFLADANLSNSGLFETNLSGANLSGVNFSGAWLIHANLENAWVSGTIFSDNDLSSVRGIETIKHLGPSTIGIDTVYRSRGRIPEVFLQGAGVPENFITYMHSLASTGFEFYSCFISYSSNDKGFATRLHSDLQAQGVRCWFAPEDLKIGAKLRPSFDEAIRMHDKVMVVLSENSVKSTWVEKEVETAFEKEHQQNRTVLFPIRLDDAVMKTSQAWAADIRRTRHVGDFRDWKNHDSYTKSFDRLLRDLKLEAKAESASQN